MTGKDKNSGWSDSLEWLDKIIEEQKQNTNIIKSICDPFDPAELQEIAEQEFDN